MSMGLLIAFGRRPHPEMQSGRAAHETARKQIRQGRRLELMPTPKKACGFLRVWRWLKNFGRKRSAMTLQASPGKCMPGAFAGKHFATLVSVLNMDASLSDSLKARYCEEFEKYYELMRCGQTGLADKVCQLAGHLVGKSVIQRDFPDEAMVKGLKLVEFEICKELECTEDDKLTAQTWLSDMFKGSLPSPDARRILSNFTTYENELRNQEVTGYSASLFAQLGLPEAVLARCHRQFDEDIVNLVSREFRALYSQNQTGDVVELIRQAYATAMDSLVQVWCKYPKGYLDTMINAATKGLADRVMSNVGPGNDWSAPAEASTQGHLPVVAMKENYEAVRDAMRTVLPQSIANHESHIKSVAREGKYPTDALEVFKSTYLNSFKERYYLLSDHGKNPVRVNAFWFDHAKALAHAADMAVSVAYGKSSIYWSDLYSFRRDLQAIFCDINLALLGHEVLGTFRQTMTSDLFGLSDVAPPLKRGQRFALHSSTGIR